MDTEIHEIPVQPINEMVSGKSRSALIWAAEAHEGQYRKQVKNSLNPESSVPYLVHLVTVMNILVRAGASRNLICAGCLHDIVEDCDVSIDQIRDEFGGRVARYVWAVTKDEQLAKLSFEDKAAAIVDKCRENGGVNACALKAADLLANMSDLVWAAEDSDSPANDFKQLYGSKNDRWILKIEHYLRLSSLLIDEIEMNYPDLAISLKIRSRELKEIFEFAKTE